MDPSELPDACRRAGLDGVAITEHDPVSFRDITTLMKSDGLTLVPAREVSVGPHHVLVFSAEEDALKQLPRRATGSDLEDSRLACVWAHPAFPGGAGVYPPLVPPYEDLRNVVHAVEILNGQRLHVIGGMEAAIQAAAALGLPGSGGSDAHVGAMVGKSYTEIDVPDGSEPAEIVDSIRRGRVVPALSRPWAELHGYDYRDDLMGYLR